MYYVCANERLVLGGHLWECTFALNRVIVLHVLNLSHVPPTKKFQDGTRGLSPGRCFIDGLEADFTLLHSCASSPPPPEEFCAAVVKEVYT